MYLSVCLSVLSLTLPESIDVTVMEAQGAVKETKVTHWLVCIEATPVKHTVMCMYAREPGCCTELQGGYSCIVKTVSN